MQQRIWPDQSIDTEKVMAGARAAARMRRNVLDEDPFWINRGPVNIGGRLTDVVGHPTDDNILYLATASGGVFKSVDAGATFFPVFDDVLTPGVGALAVDPNNPNAIYCGTGEANSAGFSYFGSGIYKSTNAGATWVQQGLTGTRYIARVVIHPENSNLVWVAAMGELFAPGGERGIYLSEDAGQTWEQKLFVNDTTGASDVVVHPENPDIVYAAMWQRFRGPENRRAGGRGSGIYKSVNRGDSWTRLSSGLPPIGDDVGRIGLAISASNPNVLYAIYADHPGYFLGLYRSNDAGESWTQTNDGDLENVYSSFGWYFGNVRVRPDDEDMVYVLGVTLHRSANGGATWSVIGDDIHVDHHAMWFDPQQPFRFYVGNDGGFYRSMNNGNSFEDLNNFPAIQYYAGTFDALEPHRLYGGTQDNGTLRSLSGQVNDYERIYGGDGFYTLVDPTDNNYVYAEYQYGGLGRSTNGGEDFNYALSGIDNDERRNWSTPVALDPNNPRVLYYGAQRLYRTSNRAQQWTAVSPDLTNGPGSGNLVFGTITTIAVSPVDSNVIWVGTDDANVWVSTNLGESWALRNDALPTRWITKVTPHFANPAEAFVTVSGYRNTDQQAHLYRTTDYGVTWINTGSTLPDVPLNDVEYDPEYVNRLYVASDFGIFWSSDYGDTWAALGHGLPPVPTLDLILDSPGRRLIAATYGRSFVSLDLDSLGANHPPAILSLVPEPNHQGAFYIQQNRDEQFAVAAEDADGDPLLYEWTVNGTQVASAATFTHHFPDTGVQVLRVQVSDGELFARDSLIIVVVDSSDAVTGANELPTSFALSAYPNPFNGAVSISLQLEAASHVRAEIYDLTGRRVKVLDDDIRSAGEHMLTWAPLQEASGMYLLRVRAGHRTFERKLLYLK
ncbi:MAG: T9SS type A sorting domain-containing protein [Calditrichaeota bacterium]|nr:T9SS type A sorting domain-containing protein [Calditrichota bacterium]